MNPSRPSSEPSNAASKNGGRRHDEHVLLETATLAGAAGGAVVGAMAGPVGAVVGGAIGAAVGMLAGEALDEDTSRRSAHDRELDDAIGITGGDLGARESAAAALTELEKRERRDSAPTMAEAEPSPKK
jgi:phage tail tape-measure protein